MTSESITSPGDRRDEAGAGRPGNEPVRRAKEIQDVLARWRAAERELELSDNGARPGLEARIAALREEYARLTDGS